MEVIPMNICKICQTEKPKSKFSGRSARCCSCMYNTKKTSLKNTTLIIQNIL